MARELPARAKPALCKYHQRGHCERGGECLFAHGEAELQQLLERAGAAGAERRGRGGQYKTRLCAAYESGGACARGSVCTFAHGAEELRAPPLQAESSAESAASSTSEATPSLPVGPPPAQRYVPGADYVQEEAANGQPAGKQPGRRRTKLAPLALRDLSVGDEGEAPDVFCCPITHEVMRDPVQAADCYTYERAAISDWLRVRQTSPMTNAPLTSTELLPNFPLRRAITAVYGRR